MLPYHIGSCEMYTVENIEGSLGYWKGALPHTIFKLHWYIENTVISWEKVIIADIYIFVTQSGVYQMPRCYKKKHKMNIRKNIMKTKPHNEVKFTLDTL